MASWEQTCIHQVSAYLFRNSKAVFFYIKQLAANLQHISIRAVAHFFAQVSLDWCIPHTFFWTLYLILCLHVK